MGLSLAVILVNVWMKLSELGRQKPEHSESISTSDQKGEEQRLHSETDFPKMWSRMGVMQNLAPCKMPKNNKWRICQHAGYCLDLYALQQSTERGRFEELFVSYLDDIICTIRGDPDEHPKGCQFITQNM